MSIIIMILLLSLLILVHEAGHFFAARAFGIKVDKFGFGLPVGPTLYKTKVGDGGSSGSCIFAWRIRFFS